MSDAIRALAVHEAGHAAAAFVLGLPVNDVVVQSRDGATRLSGYVGRYQSGLRRCAEDTPIEEPGPAPEWASASFRTFLPQAIVSAAGPAAQHMVGGGFSGNEGDERRIQHLTNLTVYCSGRQAGAWKRLVWMSARRMLRSPMVWRAIEGLADELARGLRIELLKAERGGKTGLVEFMVPSAEAERLLEAGGARRGIFERWAAVE